MYCVVVPIKVTEYPASTSQFRFCTWHMFILVPAHSYLIFVKFRLCVCSNCLLQLNRMNEKLTAATEAKLQYLLTSIMETPVRLTLMLMLRTKRWNLNNCFFYYGRCHKGS